MERTGKQCYVLFGATSAAEWQQLYVERGMIEAFAPCIRQAGDRRPEAVRLGQLLFEREQRSVETMEAVAK